MAFDNRVIRVDKEQSPLASSLVERPPIAKFVARYGNEEILRTEKKEKADALLTPGVTVHHYDTKGEPVGEYGVIDTRPKRKRSRMPKSYKQSVRDFSKKAILKSLNKHTLNHWSFQYPAAGFAGGMLWMAIVGVSEFAFGLGVGAFTIACGSLIWNRFCRADAFEKDYIDKMQKEIEQETLEKRQQLAEDLKELKCFRGVTQLKQFQADYDNLIELLQSKIDPNEITYKRYHGMIQEVYLSGIDNLRKCLTSLMSISEIDETPIRERLKQLGKIRTDDARLEADQLQRRLEIRQNRLEKVEDLLVENEAAITKLEETATLVADLDTGINEGKVSMDDSMADLMRIISRAKKNREIKEATET